MRNVLIAVVLVAAACGGNPQGAGGDGGGGGGGGTSSSGNLRFAVFGDCRPPNLNDTTGYPSAIISAIFSQAQAKGADFMIGTGDYMFASTQSAVDAQMTLFLQAQSNFKGSVYHTLGNHECTGATASNCPNGNETPNIQAFMSKLVPAGTPKPYYRVNLDTPKGKAKFVFVAANAWSSDQQTWLQQQLADPTEYTFVARHEPPTDTQTPGVGPSESIIHSNPLTIELLGHSHTYRRIDTQHVISGNGGAPMTSGGSFGFLFVEQQDDGNIAVTEIDEATGMQTDTWKVTPVGQPAQ